MGRGARAGIVVAAMVCVLARLASPAQTSFAARDLLEPPPPTQPAPLEAASRTFPDAGKHETGPPPKTAEPGPRATLPRMHEVSVAQTLGRWWGSLGVVGQLGVFTLLAAILVPLVVFWLHRYVECRDRKRATTGQFEALFKRVTPEAVNSTIPRVKEEQEAYVQDFFLGKDIDRNCLQYVAMDLDIRREALLRPAQQVFEQGRCDVCCIQIVGERQQGKTMLMARLAYDLAKSGQHAFWCALGKAPEALRKAQLIRAYYEQCQSRWKKRRLYLFLDDVIRPEDFPEGPTEGQRNAERMADTLLGCAVTIVLSGVEAILPRRVQVHTIGGSAGDPHSLALTQGEIENIVAKWREHGLLTLEKAQDFLRQSRPHRLHRKRLFALLALLYEHAADSLTHEFMRKFNREYGSVNTPERNLLYIAACQILDVPVPVRLVARLDPGFQMDHSVAVQSCFTNDPDDRVYLMGAPFLARWVLAKKLGKTTFEDLIAAYDRLLSTAFAVENFGQHAGERNFLCQLPYALATGFNSDLFGGRGQAVARYLFHQHRGNLEEYFNSKVRASGRRTTLIYWGRTFKSLRQWPLAEAAYLEAKRLLEAGASLGERLVLLNGLKDLPRTESRRAAIPLARELLDELLAQGKQRGQVATAVFTTYCELLEGLGNAREAIRLWDEYEKQGVLEADALLLMKLGSLYEILGSRCLPQAGEYYARAVQAAESEPTATQTRVNILHRYATFLADHPGLRESPRPSAIYARALRMARRHGLVWQPIVGAWAEYQESLGDIERARRHFGRVVLAYRKVGVVETHAWQGLATLLSSHATSLRGDPALHLAHAEGLCLELSNDQFVDWWPKLTTLSLHGRLVGLPSAPYKFEGRKRPDVEEAARILTEAFESPEPQRNDPACKTFHDANVHRALKDVYNQAVLRYGKEYLDVPGWAPWLRQPVKTLPSAR